MFVAKTTKTTKTAKKHTGRVGGFAGQNSGRITDCYSVVRSNTPRDITGGFVGENIGEVSHSFYSGPIHGLTGGVSCTGEGTYEQSYFFHDESEKSKKLKKLRDRLSGVRVDSVREADDKRLFLGDLGFDVENVWEHIDKPQVMRFIHDKWLYDVTKSSIYPKYVKTSTVVSPCSDDDAVVMEDVAFTEEEKVEVTSISTAEELFALAKGINEGDKKLSAAYIRLEGDIDLKGKEWEPIGFELSRAFTGLFDGNGHKVSNYKIKDSKNKAKGFFGYLKGEAYNLTVDCMIRAKDGTVGGIAAYNEEGVIGYCAAVVYIKRKEGDSGGLVGSNTGEVFGSYSAGKIEVIIIPWWWSLLLLLLLLLLIRPKGKIPVFAPIPIDPEVVQYEPATPREGSNFASFQFERKIEVNTDTGECAFYFRNPGNSNHNVVVQLQFTDANAVKVMKSTGRLVKDQTELNKNPLYDPENFRVVLAESGAVPPGYRLDNLRLVEQPNGATIPPGEYDAIVFLIFYDLVTNNRAMLESQLPVKIIVN